MGTDTDQDIGADCVRAFVDLVDRLQGLTTGLQEITGDLPLISNVLHLRGQHGIVRIGGPRVFQEGQFLSL